jgi:hypothetical protein
MLPAVRTGAAKTGRPLDRFQVCMKPLVATAANEAGLEPKVRDARGSPSMPLRRNIAPHSTISAWAISRTG